VLERALGLTEHKTTLTEAKKIYEGVLLTMSAKHADWAVLRATVKLDGLKDVFVTAVGAKKIASHIGGDESGRKMRSCSARAAARRCPGDSPTLHPQFV